MKFGLAAGLVAIICIAMAAAVHASVKVAGNAKDPTLRVSHNGVAEIGWTTTAGTRRHALVYRNGTIGWGQRLATRDVSSPSRSSRLPFALAVRQTPDGRLWALQSWRRLRGGPMELRFLVGAVPQLASPWTPRVASGKARASPAERVP